jgi:hypothetical protein
MFWDIDKFDKNTNDSENYIICLIGKKRDFYVSDYRKNKVSLTDDKNKAKLFSFDDAETIKNRFCFNFFIQKTAYKWK